MVSYYNIAGAKIGSHYMALGTWALVGGGIYAATRGPKNATAPATPAIPASSADEEKFIQEFLKAAESDSKN